VEFRIPSHDAVASLIDDAVASLIDDAVVSLIDDAVASLIDDAVVSLIDDAVASLIDGPPHGYAIVGRAPGAEADGSACRPARCTALTDRAIEAGPVLSGESCVGGVGPGATTR